MTAVVKEITCIVCPMGCPLTVTIDGENVTVKGNTCPRGEVYGKAEATHPTRVLTTTVKIANRPGRYLPVKTAAPIPRERMMEAMEHLRRVSVSAPVEMGKVVYPDLFGSDVIATDSMD